jgi:hypothetical protein
VHEFLAKFRTARCGLTGELERKSIGESNLGLGVRKGDPCNLLPENESMAIQLLQDLIGSVHLIQTTGQAAATASLTNFFADQSKTRYETAQALYHPTNTRRRNWKIECSSVSGYLSRLRLQTRHFYLIRIKLSRTYCEKYSDSLALALLPQSVSRESFLPLAKKFIKLLTFLRPDRPP